MSVAGPLVQFEVMDEDVIVALYALLSATSSVSMALFLEGVMEEHFEQRAQARFASEGDQASGQWEELLFPETHDFRVEQGFPPAHPINRRTGELFRWVTQGGGDVAPFGGSSVPGAILSWPKMPNDPETREKLHTAQAGKSDPYTPPRPVVAMDQIDLAFALSALEKWIIFSVENPSGLW